MVFGFSILLYFSEIFKYKADSLKSFNFIDMDKKTYNENQTEHNQIQSSFSYDSSKRFLHGNFFIL